MKINGNEIRPGNVILHQDNLWAAVKVNAVKPGKGGAYAQVELKNLVNGSKLNERFRASETVERVRLDQKDHTYLYAEGDMLVFMDVENYEQINIAKDLIGERVAFLQDGIDLDNLNHERDFTLQKAYAMSKLANILFTQTLAEKLAEAAPQKTLTINCFHPGFVGSGIGTQVLLGKIVMGLVRPFVRSGRKGAETGLFLATDPRVSGKNGGYYYNRKQEPLKPYARDAEMADALWQKSAAMVGL